jgi:hypothetical protein
MVPMGTIPHGMAHPQEEQVRIEPIAESLTHLHDEISPQINRLEMKIDTLMQTYKRRIVDLTYQNDELKA